MDAKHTPAPWVVHNYPHTPGHPWIDAKCNFSPKPEPDGGHYYLSVSGPISQEDARLIAAAPDLLAALEAMRDDPSIRAVCKSPLWAKMVDAIAKAKEAA